MLRHYLPAFKAGGPVRSIANMVGYLGGEFAFRVLCGDRDLGDGQPFQEVERDRWVSIKGAEVHYASPEMYRFFNIARIIRSTPHDILYLNSFFSLRATIQPLFARRLGMIPRTPLILAPRGEFSPGALALKASKKRAFIRFAQISGLLNGIIWQASSETEKHDIHNALGFTAPHIVIARNLPAPLSMTAPTFEWRKPGAPLRIVFLSRISPKKNLDYALRVLSRVRVPVQFTIVGPGEDAAYLAQCQRLAAELPPNIEVEWKDAADPSDVQAIMAQHDLFFLPTRGENYGHVIAEALGAGTPVLLSDATPWRGLAELGVGDDLPLSDPSAFATAIERSAADQPDEAAAKRRRAFAYVHQRQNDGADIEANRQLFAAALGKRHL